MPALHAGPRAAGAFAGRHPFAREMPLPAWRKGPLQGSILSSGTVRRAGSPARRGDPEGAPPCGNIRF